MNTTKVPTSVAVDAVQIIIMIMAEADKDGPAAQINLGPSVVADMRKVAREIEEVNNNG